MKTQRCFAFVPVADVSTHPVIVHSHDGSITLIEIPEDVAIVLQLQGVSCYTYDELVQQISNSIYNDEGSAETLKMLYTISGYLHRGE